MIPRTDMTKDGDDVERRFWAKVSIKSPEECWMWTGARIRREGKPQDRYGMFWLTARPRKVVRAHRMSWTLARGPIPEGAWVLHKCDEPACVNPDHLWLGSPKDNVRDMIGKGRDDFSGRKARRRRASRNRMGK